MFPEDVPVPASLFDTFATSLAAIDELIDDGLIDRAAAFAVAPNVDALKMALKGINVKSAGIM